MKEAGFQELEAGFQELEAGSWHGVFAPANTPQDILNRLSAEVVRAAKASELRAKFEEAGMNLTATSREAFARGMQSDLARWDCVVKATGFQGRTNSRLPQRHPHG